MSAMSLIEMKNAVIKKYGMDSFEAGFIQYVFANRETSYFVHTVKALLAR